MSSPPQLVVGTAGHIDHGKSSLVLALTGTDPDRLPEEKARGMTIDLGFAHSVIDGADVWFVDVPGHERFIRNMVAGATGVDAALLVVAADDSIMPQTREHAELLALLGVERCIAVLTKMDLVDESWATQVAEEAVTLLRSVGIEPSAVVQTSAQTGRGLDDLRRALVQLARIAPSATPTDPRSVGAAPAPPTPSWFRLPIDRAFVIAGRGTVVTGSVTHGAVSRDQELELLPVGRRVRVRDLQSHHDPRGAAAGRMRLAVNLAGVPLDDASRGCELATPGYLAATRCLDVWLPVLRPPGKARRTTLRVRLHIATSEVLAELRMLPAETAPSGSSGSKPDNQVVGEAPGGALSGRQFAQLTTAEPIVATWNQRFIIRDESGARTLGGGRVLNPAAHRWSARRMPTRPHLQALLGGGPAERAEQIILACQWDECSDAQLAARAGLPDAAAAATVVHHLIEANRVCVLEGAGVRALVHCDHLKSVARTVVSRLEKHLADHPRSPGVPRGEWAGWAPRAVASRLRPLVAEWLIASRKVAVLNGFVVPRDRQVELAEADRALLEALLTEYHAGGFQPPGVDALRCRSPRNDKRVRELIDLAAARGQLLRLSDGIWLHGERWRELVQRVADEIRRRGPLTVSDVRILLDSTRKFVVPICEQLDAAGVTRRSGDQRGLGPKAPPPAAGR